MAIILNIETATDTCSVALAKDGKVVALREISGERNHAALLTTFISECCTESHLTLHELDAVAVSKGPGSFTGLRIGTSTAKGICYATGKPLIAINSLQAMAANFMMQHGKPSATELLVPMIDARRMEVYHAVFDSKGDFASPTSAKIIDSQSFADYSGISRLILFGDGMNKCKTVLSEASYIQFVDGNYNSAAGMVTFSEKSYDLSAFEDVAYFEPFYLKDFFVAKQPEPPKFRP